MSNVLKPQPTALAEWYEIVREAEAVSGLRVAEELENYLVNLLLRFTDKPALADAVLGLDYLLAEQQLTPTKYSALREVGDQCLLYSGLYPERAQRRRVRISYFVEIGQRAYCSAAMNITRDAELSMLFEQLGTRFVRLMDILLSLRALAGRDKQLPLLQAVELWQDTSSESAKKIITEHTDGFVVRSR